MLNPLVIGDISARIPVIQGGMGVGISLGNLAGHVAKEGGIGIISTAQIGFNEPGYEASPLKANLRAIETQFKKAKEIAKNGIVGFNIMVATFDYEKYVSQCIEVGADVIICGAGLPVKLPELVKGTHTKFAPILSSSKAVKVLFSMWKKRYNMTADFLVVEGPEAGGHLGFSADTLEEDSKNMDTELKKIIDTVHDFEVEFGRKIPVVFGGGVFDKQDIEHYLNLGCSGVQMATRFVCTEECDAPQSFKNAYIASNEEDIIITKSPVGMPGRAIKNSFTERVKTERIPIEKCRNCLAIKHCDRKTIPYCISETLLNSAHGETDNSLVFAGSKAYKIHEMSTVKEIMEELNGEE